MAKAKTGGLGRGLGFLLGDAAIDPQPVAIKDIPDVPAGETVSAASAAEPAAEKKSTKKSAASASGSSKTKAAQSGESVVFISLGDIKPNARQPRKSFSEESLNELAASIREHGVIQPVLVRPSGKAYELVAGERRWRAARRAGLKSIPAIVRDLDDRQNMFYALIENMQREDLNALEEAEALQEIMEGWELSQEQAAAAVGKSRSYVANALRLLKLPEDVKALVAEKKLSAGHAKVIAGLSGAKLQTEAAFKAVEEGWSVRQIENYAGAKKPRKRTRRKTAKGKEFQSVEERLREQLGTKVRINGSEKKGRIELEYYSREELDRLLEILLEDE